MNTYAYKYENNLYINLTNKCCNNCDFCIRNNGDSIGDSPSLWLEKEPTASEVIQQINAFSDDYDSIVFCGYGEPTYKLDTLIEVAKYVKSINKTTRLNTNGLGSLINGRNIVNDLKDVIDVISVSLNESDSEKYDALCKPEFANAFEEILDFTKKCVQVGVNTVMSVVRVDGLDVEKCAQVCASTGATFRVREKI